MPMLGGGGGGGVQTSAQLWARNVLGGKEKV